MCKALPCLTMPKGNLDKRAARLKNAQRLVHAQLNNIEVSRYSICRSCESSCERTVRKFVYSGEDISVSTFLELLEITGLQIVPKQSTVDV